LAPSVRCGVDEKAAASNVAASNPGSGAFANPWQSGDSVVQHGWVSCREHFCAIGWELISATGGQDVLAHRHAFEVVFVRALGVHVVGLQQQ
jgi:hypothetical protein